MIATMARYAGLAALFLGGVAAASETPAEMELASRFRAAEAWMNQHLVSAVGPGATAAVLYDQNVVWSHAYGYADLEAGRAATPDTQFSICSISKLFTSVAVMSLVEDGRIDLDAEFGTYLEDFNPAVPEGVVAEPITIRSALSHSSGLPREGVGAYWNSKVFPEVAELEATVNEPGRLYTPMTNYQYSNIAMSLLGKIIEKVSGKSYDQYVHETILDPLGLQGVETDWPLDNKGGRFAMGYTDHDARGKREPVPYYQLRGFSPAAGYVASVVELAKFAAWQFRLMDTGEEEVLRRTTLRDMQRVHWMDPYDEEARIYGLGFSHHRLGGEPVIGHGGYCLGHRAQLSMEPNKKIAVATMVNSNDIDPAAIGAAIYGLVSGSLGKKPVADAKKKDADSKKIQAFQAFEGEYRWPKSPEGSYVIPKANGEIEIISLYSDNPAKWASTYRHVEGDLFRRVRKEGDLGETLLFEKDDKGRVISLLTHGYRYTRI
jgi:CubicO group peptidase (beta-lactamase class C family)